MKPQRPEVVKDAEQHLKREMVQVLSRHLAMMQAGGMSTLEASAAVLGAVEAMSAVAIALSVHQNAKPHARRGFITTVLARLLIGVEGRADVLVELMNETDDAMAAFR